METVNILQILTNVEELQQLADVAFSLDEQSQGLSPLRKRCHARYQGQDLIQLAQLAWREFWETPAVIKAVRQVPVLREVTLNLMEWDNIIIHFNLVPTNRKLVMVTFGDASSITSSGIIITMDFKKCHT